VHQKGQARFAPQIVLITKLGTAFEVPRSDEAAYRRHSEIENVNHYFFRIAVVAA
jgi:hypothetical protein